MTLAFPLMSLAIFLILHGLAWQVFSRKGVAKLLVVSTVAGVATFTAYRFYEVPVELTYALSTHAFLTMLYMHFYVGVDRSVSIRVLNELLLAPHQQLSREDLERAYPQKTMFEHRIELMVRQNWMAQKGQQLFSSAKSKSLVLPTRLLRLVFNLKETW